MLYSISGKLLWHYENNNQLWGVKSVSHQAISHDSAVDCKLIPRLCYSWTISKSHNTYKSEIKKIYGVKFLISSNYLTCIYTKHLQTPLLFSFYSRNGTSKVFFLFVFLILHLPFPCCTKPLWWNYMQKEKKVLMNKP